MFRAGFLITAGSAACVAVGAMTRIHSRRRAASVALTTSSRDPFVAAARNVASRLEHWRALTALPGVLARVCGESGPRYFLTRRATTPPDHGALFGCNRPPIADWKPENAKCRLAKLRGATLEDLLAATDPLRAPDWLPPRGACDTAA